MSISTHRAGSLALLFDSFFRMGTTFFVSILIARQYGPEDLGTITASLALVVLVVGFSNLGLNAVLVQEFIEHPRNAATLLLSVTVGKIIAGSLLATGLIIILWKSGITHEWVLPAIIACGFIFTAFDTAEWFLHANSIFVKLVMTRAFAIIISSIFKLLILWLDAGLVLLAVGYALDYLLLYIFPTIWLVVAYRKGAIAINGRWHFSPKLLATLLRRSWPIILGGGFAQINLRSDVVLLAALASPLQAGIYAAAAKLSDAWAMAAAAIVSARYPSLAVSSRKSPKLYAEELSSLFKELIFIAVLGAALVIFLADFIVGAIYGDAFSAAATVLSVHIIGGGFLFLRAAVDRWIVLEKVLVFSLTSQAIGATTNLTLNLLLIPEMGALGSAWASVASYAIGSLIFLGLHWKTRPLFFLILLSVVPGRRSEMMRISFARKIMLARP